MAELQQQHRFFRKEKVNANLEVDEKTRKSGFTELHFVFYHHEFYCGLKTVMVLFRGFIYVEYETNGFIENNIQREVVFRLEYHCIVAKPPSPALSG